MCYFSPKELSNEGRHKPDQPLLLASHIRDGQAKNCEMLQRNITSNPPVFCKELIMLRLSSATHSLGGLGQGVRNFAALSTL